MYSEHVGWKRHRCGVTSDTVLWYARIAAITPAARRAEKPRLAEELFQLPLNVSVLCTLYACPGDHYNIPSRCKRPAVDDLSDPSFRAIPFDCSAHLLAYYEAEAARSEFIRNHAQYHHAPRKRAPTPKHRRELLVSRQRCEPAHPPLDRGQLQSAPGATHLEHTRSGLSRHSCPKAQLPSAGYPLWLIRPFRHMTLL